MLENAVRICDAKFGNIYRLEDDALHLVASHNTPPGLRRDTAGVHRCALIRCPNSLRRMVATKAVIQVAEFGVVGQILRNAIR